MPKAFSATAAVFSALALLSMACRTLSPQSAQVPSAAPTQAGAVTQPVVTPTTPAPAPVEQIAQPVRISGEFDYTNDIITTYYVEQAVALVDLYGFVQRDLEWEIPVDSQTLGFLDLDPAARHGVFRLDLPARPNGTPVDVDNDGQQDGGLQVFSVAYWPNLIGGPYSEGDDLSRGWPAYLTSTVTDPENQDEITGGRLVVWSPDDQQAFPTAFGADGLLFTADDPTAPIPAGYSVIDLDQSPFEILRDEEITATLYEPQDVAIKDYSAMTYTEAFDALLAKLRSEYAFNNVADKAPDWDALAGQLRPRVAEAEIEQDPREFFLALRDFTWAFKDGHVGLSAGALEDQVFAEESDGGYGLALRELDDGRLIAVYVLPGGPADQAGIQVGAEITRFNDQPIAEAVEQVNPLSAPFSTEFSRRYQQVRYLLRAPLGTETRLTYTNPGSASPLTVTVQAIAEQESFAFTSVFRGFDPTALPVEYRILESGAGWVRINSNYDDLNLIVRLFERALQVFQANQVPGIIIDLRQNSGGAWLGLAGFLTSEEIPLGQLEYYSDKTGQFEPEGVRDVVLPFENQYSFGQMALLVSQACASACELEAYGFSQVPGMSVVGETPTAGVEAEVARGQFLLPEGLSLQVPTGRYTLPDGSIFIEGQGIAPTLRVPVTEENVLSTDDVVLMTAEEAVLTPEGAGVTPAGPPEVLAPAEARRLIEQGIPALEDLAREQYPSTSHEGQTYNYTVPLGESQPVAWLNGWCAASTETLEDNYTQITQTFRLEEDELDRDQLASIDFASQDNLQCRYFYTVLDNWPSGEHHLAVQVTFDQPINDGTAVYPAGTHLYEYTVYVEP